MHPENTSSPPRKADSWWLEILLSVLLALPWLYAGMDSAWRILLWVASVALYWFLVLAMFGRGSAITSFLVVLILATLIVLGKRAL